VAIALDPLGHLLFRDVLDCNLQERTGLSKMLHMAANAI
jgi:hypothetical protein